MHLWHMFCKSSKGGDCCSKQCSIALFDQFAKHIQLNLTISLSWDICRFIELHSFLVFEIFDCTIVPMNAKTSKSISKLHKLFEKWSYAEIGHSSAEIRQFEQAFRKVVICWNRILERWNTSVWRLLKTVLKK